MNGRASNHFLPQIQDRLRRLQRRAEKEHDVLAKLETKYSPFDAKIRSIVNVNDTQKKQQLDLDHQKRTERVRLEQEWGKRHPKVIAVDSKSMILKVTAREGISLPKVSTTSSDSPSRKFVHTTRLAAWRATRFKGHGTKPQELHGLAYTDFLERVAITRNAGDAVAAQKLSGGYSRAGGPPLVFPIIHKPGRPPELKKSSLFEPSRREEWEERTPGSLPKLWPTRHLDPLRRNTREERSVVPKPQRSVLHKPTDTGQSKLHGKRVYVISGVDHPANAADTASKNTISSVCSWCSTQARPPPSKLSLDPAVLKVPRSKHSLWRRSCDVLCQTDPVPEPIAVPSGLEAYEEWKFLADDSLGGTTPVANCYEDLDAMGEDDEGKLNEREEEENGPSLMEDESTEPTERYVVEERPVETECFYNLEQFSQRESNLEYETYLLFETQTSFQKGRVAEEKKIPIEMKEKGEQIYYDDEPAEKQTGESEWEKNEENKKCVYIKNPNDSEQKGSFVKLVSEYVHEIISKSSEELLRDSSAMFVNENISKSSDTLSEVTGQFVQDIISKTTETLVCQSPAKSVDTIISSSKEKLVMKFSAECINDMISKSNEKIINDFLVEHIDGTIPECRKKLVNEFPAKHAYEIISESKEKLANESSAEFVNKTISKSNKQVVHEFSVENVDDITSERNEHLPKELSVKHAADITFESDDLVAFELLSKRPKRPWKSFDETCSELELDSLSQSAMEPTPFEEESGDEDQYRDYCQYTDYGISDGETGTLQVSTNDSSVDRVGQEYTQDEETDMLRPSSKETIEDLVVPEYVD